MNAPKGDTIYALSSGRPPAAIAVIRISGPRAREGLEKLTGKPAPEPRKAAHAFVREADKKIIDDALALFFPGPNSETGEDVAEIHMHGGRALVAAAFQVLGNIEGFRPAEAGEFTRRAFLNGKIDLTAVEALGDLIAAETEAQRRQAILQFRGQLSKITNEWRTRVLDALALVEAAIDFSDEGDVPQDLLTKALADASLIADEISIELKDKNRGEKLREGFVVAITGPANAGKSTLLNTLAKRDVAIVTDIPGTTRDQIEVMLDLNGVPVVLVDTAGIREAHDPVEKEGIRRALARAHEADLVLWLVDAEDHYPPAPPAKAAKTVMVRTKADRLASDTRSGASDISPKIPDALLISAHTGEGMEQLIEVLAAEAQELTRIPAIITQERHRHALSDARDRLRAAIQERPAGQEEIIAEELRLAARALGRVTGRVDVEEVLDRIFKNFCIGK